MSSQTEISAAELNAVAERIRALRQMATEHAVEIGRELLRVKASLPHGVFLKWVETACEFKIRTAQDLMKLAREAESNTKLVALMVPSTLRLLLSKSTPPAVRSKILTRVEDGERISRNQVQSEIAASRSCNEKQSAQKAVEYSRSPAPPFLDVANTRTALEEDRSRIVAELLIHRLSKTDYDFVMDGMTWGVWNRVFVWMRAAAAMAEKAETAQAPARHTHPQTDAHRLQQ